MKLLAVLASLVVAAACGSKAPATATTTGGGDSTGSATPVLPDVPFEKLDHDQQIQYMKEVVVPTMTPLFQEHDAKEFAEFGCKTCHGPGAEKGEFDMPNPALPKLNFKDMSKHEKEDLEWMGKVIKPTMAKLLKEPEYNESTPDGFGCLHCHTAEAP